MSSSSHLNYRDFPERVHQKPPVAMQHAISWKTLGLCLSKRGTHYLRALVLFSKHMVFLQKQRCIKYKQIYCLRLSYFSRKCWLSVFWNTHFPLSVSPFFSSDVFTYCTPQSFSATVDCRKRKCCRVNDRHSLSFNVRYDKNEWLNKIVKTLPLLHSQYFWYWKLIQYFLLFLAS